MKTNDADAAMSGDLVDDDNLQMDPHDVFVQLNKQIRHVVPATGNTDGDRVAQSVLFVIMLLEKTAMIM